MRSDRTKPRTVLPDDVNIYRLVTEKEAAELLSIHFMTLRKMSARGEGPPRIKISEYRIAYRLRDVIAYQNARAKVGRTRLVKKPRASEHGTKDQCPATEKV
jgi:hypothetical protein